MGKEKWELIAKKVYLSPSCAVLADIVLVRAWALRIFFVIFGFFFLVGF